jgi:hypothetical protein
MTIKAKPFESGAGASVPDASESTKGKIKIATTSESNTGTDDLTAMTPAKVKARIDAALVGGIDYKGTFNATTGLTNSGGNLNNAEQGDLYVIDTAGTIYGATWAVGDHLLINADMGGSISNSKIDKVDNTDLVTSVNGQTGAVNIYADDSTLNIAGTGLSISGSGATSTLNADSASESAAGIIEIATNAEATSGSATDKALVPSNLSSVGTSQLNNDAGFITSVASASDSAAGIIEIATNAEATAGSATDKALVPSNLSSVGTSQLNNDAGFITSVASASDTTAGIIEIATNAEATAGSATDKALVPSNVASLSIANTQVTGLGTASTAASTDFLSGTGADTLGGNLDVGTHDIVSSSNADIDLAPDGTGLVSIKGNTTGGVNPGTLKLWCENNSHGISIKSPPHSATASYELVLPTGVGTSGQVLKTDGGDGGTPNSVQLAWVDQSGGSGGSVPAVRSVSQSTDYTITTYTGVEEVFLITSGANISINIPAASTVGAGYKYQIKNLGAHTLTIDPNSSETIDTSATFAISTQYAAITIITDGSNWFII